MIKMRSKVMDKQTMVTVVFNTLPNFRCLLSEWQEMGGYKGFLKSYGISIRQIQKVKTQVLNSDQYPIIAWEG